MCPNSLAMVPSKEIKYAITGLAKGVWGDEEEEKRRGELITSERIYDVIVRIKYTE